MDDAGSAVCEGGGLGDARAAVAPENRVADERVFERVVDQERQPGQCSDDVDADGDRHCRLS